MNPLHSLSNTTLPKTDVYTDLASLESLKHTDNKSEALKKISQQFESLFVNQMLKSMREANAVFEQDSPFSSEDAKFYRDMHDQQLALTLSSGRGLGIADAMYRQLSSQYNIKTNEQDAATEAFSQQRIERTLVQPAFNKNIPIAETKAQVGVPYALKSVSAQVLNQASSAIAKTPNDKNAESIKAHRVSVAQTPEEYIDSLLPYANQASKKLGVDPLVLISQSALETGWGKHVIANSKGESSNNLFNIKAHSGWHGDKITTTSIEFEEGRFTPKASNFRQYNSLNESIDDYIHFIQSNPRYEKALASVGSARQYVEEITKAGYATDPEYAQKVMSVLKRVISYVNQSSSVQSDLKKW